MRPRSHVPVTLAAFATFFAAHAAAQETQSRDQNYFAAKLMLGIGGSVDVGLANVSASDDAELTFGAGVAYMVPLHRYFVLGGQLAVQSWLTQNGDNANASRNVLGDLTIVPQGRLPLTHDIELYLAVPIGASLDFLNQAGANVGGIANVDVDPAVGFTVSFMAGARFALSENVGLLAEAGYALHSFSHNVSAQAGGIGVSLNNNIDIDIGQFALNAGVFF